MSNDIPGPLADASDEIPASATEAADGVLLIPPKRTRPPGSGRQRGTPNHVNRNARELIITKGKPIEFLCRVVRGKRIRLDGGSWVYPSLDQRLMASKWLLDRVSPVLAAAAVEVAGTALFAPEPKLSPEERIALWSPVVRVALEGVEHRPPRSAPAVVIAPPSKEAPQAACGGAA